MANLEVSYCGVKYRNPLVLASASPGWDGEAMLFAAKAGIGGVIPKTIGPKDDWSAQPRNGRMVLHRYNNRPIGMINLELFTDKTREQWAQEEFAIAKSGGATMHISVMAMPEPEETAEIVKTLQDSGMVDLFELNASCPMPSASAGMHIGKDWELVAAQVKACKAVSKVPFTVKLTPNVADMVPIAKACVGEGADGITISNTIKSFAGVDIETGIPYLRAFGGYSGAAIKPIVMRHLIEVAKAVDVPISAVGGVTSYKDIVEYIMIGASTVQICTEVMLNGYGVITKILKDLDGWMDAKGYRSFDEIRGIALGRLTTVEQLATEEPKFSHIDADRCTNCGKCQKSCFYRAIGEGDGVRRVLDGECDGCGLCAQVCPVGAISLY